MKKLLSSFALAALLLTLLPQAALAQARSIESLIPDDVLVSGRITPGGFLQKLVVSGLKKKEEEPGGSTAMHDLVTAKFESGTDFFFAMSKYQTLLASFEATDEEWQKLARELSLERDYKHPARTDAIAIYHDADSQTYLLRERPFIVLEASDIEPQAILDVANIVLKIERNPLEDSTKYRQVASKYLSPSIFSLYLNLKDLLNVTEKELPQNPDFSSLITPTAFAPNDYSEIGEFSPLQGGTLKKIPVGYEYQYSVFGDAEKMSTAGIRYDENTYTPSLHTKLPDVPLLFYGSSFNAKAQLAQYQKMSGEGSQQSLDQSFAMIHGFTGINFQKLLELDDEIFFAVQYDPGTLLPYFTILGKVSDTSRPALGEFSNSVNAAITKALTEDPEAAEKNNVEIGTKGLLTQYRFGIEALDKNSTEKFSGTELVATIGITNDDYFILSNFPGIEEFKGSLHKELNPYLQRLAAPVTGFTFANLRGLWDYIDRFVQLGSEEMPDLDFYKGYYGFLEHAYPWKTLWGYSEATAYTSTSRGELITDSAKHPTYKAYLESIQRNDVDGDGTNDFDELFVYHTDPKTADSDKDGIFDVEEVTRGMNVNGSGKLFSDLDEETFYTHEVGLLNRSGAIAGYPDGTFQPGRSVNRAEFVTMVMRGFENFEPQPPILNEEVRRFGVFADVEYSQWFTPFVEQAYYRGLVSGNPGKDGQLYFRPGDPITRAEAIAILNKASKTLNKGQFLFIGAPVSECNAAENPFQDVPTDQWFCGAVVSAYKNGITKGRAEGYFVPGGQLNRAEAAVMIVRTLELDLRTRISDDSSVLDGLLQSSFYRLNPPLSRP